jgi:hypothetical protein
LSHDQIYSCAYLTESLLHRSIRVGCYRIQIWKMGDAMHQQNECREFDPVEAACAVAQYLLADPAIWVERCALAGIVLTTTCDGLFQVYGDFTDRAQAKFLAAWLNLTPGGTEAVVQYLRQRQSATA